MVEIINNVAERIRSIGYYALATVKSCLCLTYLTEATKEKNDSQGFVKQFLAYHECIIITLREHINSFANDFHDFGTSDFSTILIETYEKMTWFLRSHLNKFYFIS